MASLTGFVVVKYRSVDAMGLIAVLIGERSQLYGLHDMFGIVSEQSAPNSQQNKCSAKNHPKK